MAAREPSPVLLTPIDNLMPRAHVCKFLFFPEPLGLDVSSVVDTLRSGLALTLKAIPQLSGTVQPVQDGGQQGRVCVNAPWHSISDIFRVKDLKHVKGLEYAGLRDQQFPSKALADQPLQPQDQMEADEKPVLLVQVNLVKGGLIVAFCMHHAVTDGNGTAAVAKVWAAYCRGDDGAALVTPDMVDRGRLMHGWGSASLQEFPEFDVLPPEAQEIPPTMRLLASIQLDTGYFFFSKSKLAMLKELASGDSVKEGGEWISTNDALCALLNCCIHSANILGVKDGKDGHGRIQDQQSTINATDDRMVGFGIAVNARRVLEPPLNADYIGNVLKLVSVVLPRRTMEPTIGKVIEGARLARHALKKVDEQYFGRLISAIESEPDLRRVCPSHGSVNIETIVISSWRTQGFYDLDFGDAVGTKIERVRVIVPFPNVCVIMPELKGPAVTDDESGLEVGIFLEHSQMENLKADQLFNQFAQWRCH